MKSSPAVREYAGKAKRFPLLAGWTVSLVLHALLFVSPFSPLAVEPRVPLALALHLVPEEPRSESLPSPEPLKPHTVPEVGAQRTAHARERDASEPSRPPEAKSLPARSSPVPASASHSSPASESRMPAADETMPGGERQPRLDTTPATVALSEMASVGELDASALRQYRLALALAARRHRLYPLAARRQGLSGVATLAITVGPASARVALARSSGHALLDEAARQMVEKALAEVPPPARAFGFELDVAFALEE